MRFRRFFFLLRFLILDFLYFLSSAESDLLLLLDLLHFMLSGESDLLNYEYENNGSDSGFSGRCFFTFHFYDPVGRVSGLGSGVFVPTGLDSKYDVFTFFLFVSIVFDSKGGRLIKKMALKFIILPPNLKTSLLL